MQSPPILTSDIETPTGSIGRLTLNNPSSLNALNLQMVTLIQKQLDQWARQDDIKAIWIEGSGGKAFCAGGDVQALYHSAKEKPGGPCRYAESFFKHEYTMNYTLHTYNKPIICWGEGIIMGGGLGILAGSSHRVVTENSRIAMPEITIGLFPDVGGSWFLNRMPGKSGLFLALTGAEINAHDALFCNIADHHIHSHEKEAAFGALSAISYTDSPKINAELVSLALQQRTKEPRCSSQVSAHIDLINSLCSANDATDVISLITSLHTNNEWLAAAVNGLTSGSPLAARWIFHQLNTSNHCSLEEIFQSELLLATNIIRHPEFCEGVRALLIDKDRKPRWQYLHSEKIPQEKVLEFFIPPWRENPLRLP